MDDNCVNVANLGQTDTDHDGKGDPCDSTPRGPDTDADTVADMDDNCVNVANASQADIDHDGKGDACDDSDGDGLVDAADNCRTTANSSQADADHDGAGDACDATPRGPDTDRDGVADMDDNCPAAANASQADADHDGKGDACDTTPYGTPAEQVATLSTTVASYATGSDLTALNSALAKIQADITAGNAAKACTDSAAFQATIWNAFGRSLSFSEALDLYSRDQRLETTLGC
jgi:hypothetical protein